MRGPLVSEARERACGRCGSWAGPREHDKGSGGNGSASLGPTAKWRRAGQLGQASKPPAAQVWFLFPFSFLFSFKFVSKAILKIDFEFKSNKNQNHNTQ
jgi:hypothetical protein